MQVEDLYINLFVTINDNPFITETIVVTWGIMLFLVALSLLITRNLKEIPGTLQQLMEVVMDGVLWLVDNTMGEDKRGFAPYMLTLSLFILCANLVGLFGLRQPTADLNTAMAAALITFLMVHYFGVKSKGGLGYIKSFFQPLAFLFPLNIVSELSLPISLGFRLFGNMLGSVVIMWLFYGFAPWIIPVVGHAYFDIFAGVIQTFIFVMLTMTFVTLAME